MGVDSNNMDAFEQKLRETLENYEVPYNSSDWSQMERALASGVRGWGHGRTVIAGLLLGAALLIGGTAYYIGKDAVTEEASGTATMTTTSATATAVLAVQELEPEAMAKDAPAAATTGMAGGSGTLSNTPTEQPGSPMGQGSSTTPVAEASVIAATVTSGSATPDPTPEPASTATTFKVSVKEACPGSPVEFMVENMPEDGIYLWNFGDGSFSNKANPQHVYSKPGNYQVMLSMSASGAGSIHNKPTSDMIVIHESPLASFNIVKMDYKGEVPSVHFESGALGGTSYFWDFGDGTVSTEMSPNHVYRKRGTYQVVQTVTNAIGCTDRKSQELVVEHDFDLGAPKSFSPNDDGKDDSFMPKALTRLTSKFVLAVYDPNGGVVYSTSDATHPWYGKVKNHGAVLPAGDYVWVVDVTTDRGTETFTGTVKLIP